MKRPPAARGSISSRDNTHQQVPPPAARQLETEGDAKARALRSAVCMIDIGNYFVFFLYKKAQSIPVDMRRYRFFKDV